MTAETYNFRKPGRLGSDLEQRLGAWLRGSCALAPERWAKHMAFAVEIAFQGLEIVQPGEGLSRLPEDVIAFRVTFGDDEVITLLAMPRRLALVLVGGTLGDAGAELPADRELTVIESSLCEYVLQHLLFPLLLETWPGLEALRIRVGQREPNPQRTRMFPHDQNLANCAFVVRGPFGEQTWSWLMPQKGLLEQAARMQPALDPSQEDEVKQRLELLVRDLPTELAVMLGSVELPLSYLAQLRAGDLVILNQRVSAPLPASVAGQKRFQVWPGRVGSRQALQIESLIEG
jgi:flagellar motor switch protein FliM